jgi:hypothetical protein
MRERLGFWWIAVLGVLGPSVPCALLRKKGDDVVLVWWLLCLEMSAGGRRPRRHKTWKLLAKTTQREGKRCVRQCWALGTWR